MYETVKRTQKQMHLVHSLISVPQNSQELKYYKSGCQHITVQWHGRQMPLGKE